MPRRRPNSSTRSSKKKAVLGCLLVILATYLAMIRRLLSSSSSSLPPSTGSLSSMNSLLSIPIPPLDDLVQGWNITGNVSWLMDFSIVGFPKTGTSTLMFYLEQYKDSIFIFPDERCELGWNQHVKLIRAMYRKYHPQRRMGIKCPRDLEIDLSLSNYHQFFPTTKFIVGLRHPILWFESFYNFRVTNEFPMPPPEKLIGKCVRANQGLCTYRANFSNHLQTIESWRPVFLYHVDQLREDPDGPQFRHDLGNFLNVLRPLTLPMIWIKPGQTDLTPEKQQEIDALKMDICQERYANLRQVLMAQGTKSAKWIEDVFLLQSNVVVSNHERFVALLNSWHSDPCDQRNVTITNSA